MRRAFGLLSVLANLAIGLACLALGLLGRVAATEMFVPLVPLEPESVSTALMVFGAFAVGASLLAIKQGVFARLPLLVGSLLIVFVLVAAVFRSDYRFDGLEAFQRHGLLTLGSLVLAYASWVRLRMPKPRERLYR